MSKKIPEGNSVIPSLSIKDAAKAIKLYEKAFGAKEMYSMPCPSGSGKLMHACIMIGNSKVFIADANPEMGCLPTTSNFYVYVDNVDATFKQARQAGLSETFAVKDMFWGDRMGVVKDPFGVTWTLATHVRDVSPEEMEEGRKNFGKAA